MKNVTGIIILLVFVFISMMGCQDVTVGYLMTSNATYTPDSMVVKAVLDPVEDERQIKFEIPWAVGHLLKVFKELFLWFIQ